MKTITAIAKNSTVLNLDELTSRYKTSNDADGKSPKTVTWYDDMLRLFFSYVKEKQLSCDVSTFNMDVVTLSRPTVIKT
jgi:hypothetical protein